MIRLDALSQTITKAGNAAAGLASLALSPTSKAAVGQLCTRTWIEATDFTSTGIIDLYTCEDRARSGIPLRSPFAIVCIDTTGISGAEDAQDLYETLVGLLREHDLHYNPVLLIHSADLGSLKPLLSCATTPFAPLSVEQLVLLLLSHPPRTELIRLIRRHSPLSTLNPYVYKGPVGPNLFRGRFEQQAKLRNMEASYALVGPRAMGKTSLMNHVYEQLRTEEKVVIRVEFSPTMSELDVVYQVFDRFIREYEAEPLLYNRLSLKQLSHVIDDFSLRRRTGKRHPVYVFVDEADELAGKCPGFTDACRQFHHNGWARFLFIGYKHLRKALSNAIHSSLMNMAQPLSLTGLNRSEAGSLVLEPMMEIGVLVQEPDKVVDVLYREAGSSPSRIQLLCYYLVENASAKGVRNLTVEDARNAINLPDVHKELIRWFFESTSPREQWLAGVAALLAPCTEGEFIERASAMVGGGQEPAIRLEMMDLVTADVLDFMEDGRLHFTFPALSEIVRPPGEPRQVLERLKGWGRKEFSHAADA